MSWFYIFIIYHSLIYYGNSELGIVSSYMSHNILQLVILWEYRTRGRSVLVLYSHNIFHYSQFFISMAI